LTLTEIPCQLSTIVANDGEPLLLIGDDGQHMMLWPTPAIASHAFEFARWTKRNVDRFRGKRVLYNHPLCERTQRWAQWLGVNLEQGVV
jgi:hypothetical protein